MSFFGRFSLFLPKWKCFAQPIFLRDQLNNCWAFFYKLMLILRSCNKWLIFRRQKMKVDLTREKFFLTFLCWDDLKVFFKAKKILFEKKNSKVLKFLASLKANIKAASSKLWSLNSKKFRVTFFFIMLKNFSCYLY